ncbi:MAG: peptidylprolyl isomerase [Planctomycetota bacterium]|nr:MAG: peptidylprolyl isomerase [Planctomycetota bacterium]
MPQLSSQSPAKIVAESRSNRSGILIGGTLVVLIAGGISMQVWRAQTTQAAEQKSDDGSTKTRMDAQNTAFARVNAEPISYEALAKECVERYGKEVLENMISRLIIQQECAERGVVVSEAEVTQQVIEISKKFGLAVDQYYKLLEAERGLSPTQYQRDIIWPMLALRKLAGKEVTITREMMQQAYEDNYGPRVKARMIVCDKQRRAQEVWDKAKAKPEDFDALARDYSVETNSRALGGVIPPIRKNTGAHENLRKAAFAMKEPGEISGILQIGPSQFAILKFEGQTEPVDHDPKDVQVQLQADLTEREVQKMVGDTFETLQKSARVDNFLTGESRGTVERASAIQEAAPGTPATE